MVSFEQYLNSRFRLVSLSRDMYLREPISNGITFTFALVMSGMKWEYFSAFLVGAFRILVSSGTVSSKMNSSFVNQCCDIWSLRGNTKVTSISALS